MGIIGKIECLYNGIIVLNIHSFHVPSYFVLVFLIYYIRQSAGRLKAFEHLEAAVHQTERQGIPSDYIKGTEEGRREAP